jgi:hypothetical protein
MVDVTKVTFGTLIMSGTIVWSEPMQQSLPAVPVGVIRNATAQADCFLDSWISDTVCHFVCFQQISNVGTIYFDYHSQAGLRSVAGNLAVDQIIVV